MKRAFYFVCVFALSCLFGCSKMEVQPSDSDLVFNDLAAVWDDEEGVASVIGTIRAKDREDIPEFIVNLSNSPSKPQGLEESISISDGHWHKVLHDGVIFIERDGKIFNVLGQPVR